MALKALTIRDPIHGDILVGPVQAALIDTPQFQRLRYIRQNGLLHFVFPGAVHTRFGHSVGTMHLARRVFTRLFPQYAPLDLGGASRKDPLLYVGTVFECAALLHDIGHCAFSHSIERVEIHGGPFFYAMEQLVAEWSIPDLSAWWTDARDRDGYKAPDRTEHEQLGLLLIGAMCAAPFGDDVATQCKAALDVEARVFADDIRAMLADQPLAPSATFVAAAAEITKNLEGAGEIDASSRANQLLNALHTLISGTLDVDRLDYLVRDSRFTGTTYGTCDVEVLTNALELVVDNIAGQKTIVAAIRERAARAVDDMLWSRYQLFAQVLNHKTNVILNAMLAAAIPEAVQSASIHVGRPRTHVEFLEFTDDFVMSQVVRECLRVQQPHRAYDRALVHRDLPLHLGSVELSGDAGKDAVRLDREAERLAQTVETDVANVERWRSESALVKGGGMPVVIRQDKAKKTRTILHPSDPGAYQIVDWTTSGKLPAKVELVHFFVDRSKVKT